MNLYVTKPIDEDQRQKRIDENEFRYFPRSRFSFINVHKGFRPGCMHVLLSTTGAGKTTMARSILADVASERKVLWYSTEETHEQFETQLAYSNLHNTNKIRFVSEQTLMDRIDNKYDDVAGFMHQFDWAIDEVNPDIIFFDNITTSLMYDHNMKASLVTRQLRKLMREKNLPLFMIAHTESRIKNNEWFESNNIRGFKDITNTAEYVYCLYRYNVVVSGVPYMAAFINVDKSRLHDGAKFIYKLEYDRDLKLYTADTQIDFDSFQRVTKKVRP
jgi:KaiC/GvpD/RAD55 family RecA-like ATPase